MQNRLRIRPCNPLALLVLTAGIGLSGLVINGSGDGVALASQETLSGRVTETMDSGGYTYVRVLTGEGEVWAAAPQTAVGVGDSVTFPSAMPMAGFHSKTLNRTFEKIYFVPAIRVDERGEADASAGSSPKSPKSSTRPAAPGGKVGRTPPSSVDLSGIVKPDGGVTVGEIYARSAALAGGEVVFRARVVKRNNAIMGRNWLHVRDGTAGPGGENDLTITTSGTADVGDTVLVRGTLTVDKDFGYGYRYDLIVEDAQVTVESADAKAT
jgi:hypothetical protein